MTSTNSSFVASFVREFPELYPILQDHQLDNFGELLPHIFFGDLSRHIISSFISYQKDDRQKNPLAMLDALEKAFADGSEDTRNLISVSFLEYLPFPGEDGYEIIGHLGPALTKELEMIRSLP